MYVNVSALRGKRFSEKAPRDLDTSYEEEARDDFHGEDLHPAFLSASSPAPGLLRSRSTIERIHETTKDYTKEAMEVMIVADPTWLDRDMLERAAVEQQKRLQGCFTLPISVAFFMLFSLSAYLHGDIANVYMVESGLRKELGAGLDEVNSIEEVWGWLRNSLLPKAFRQVDFNGDPIADKLQWSRVLSYNQLQGPLILEQLRSDTMNCSDPSPAFWPLASLDIAAHMTCYPKHSSSTAPFGRAVAGSIPAPSSGEYAGGEVSSDQRSRYYTSAFEPIGAHSERRLRPMRPQYMSRLAGGSVQDGDAFQTFLYANTKYSLIQEHVDYLFQRGWLDSQSKELTIRALLLNAEVGRPRLEQLSIKVSFSRGGGVFTRMTLESLFLLTWHGLSSLGADCLSLLSLIIFTALELRKCCQAVRGVRRTESRMKRLLNFLTIFFGWMIVLGYFYQDRLRSTVVTDFQEVTQAQLSDVPADTNTLGPKLLESCETATFFNGWFRLLIAQYHFVLMLSFFTAFQAQPRLGVVVNTLESSFVDLVHFLLVLLPTFVAFAISGHFIFGRRIEEFATLDGAIGLCFKLLMEGEYDWPELSEESFLISLVWTWGFMIVMVLLMLNMVLGIVLDVYTDMRKQSGKSETVLETLRLTFLRIRHTCSWVSTHDIIARLEGMEQHITVQEFRKCFPEMCEAQYKTLVHDHSQRKSEGGGALSGWHGSSKLVLACQLNLNRIVQGMRQLQAKAEDGDGTARDPRSGLRYESDVAGGGWMQRLSERMAVHNHSLLSLQWSLQQLLWQCQAMNTLYGPGGRIPAPQEGGDLLAERSKGPL